MLYEEDIRWPLNTNGICTWSYSKCMQVQILGVKVA